MPFVVVNRNKKKLPDKVLSPIIKKLPEIVANALTAWTPEGKLTPNDIEVWVQDFGPLDLNTKDIEIVIWANLYPEREANLPVRQKFITEKVKQLVSKGITGFVWVLLQPASFGEF